MTRKLALEPQKCTGCTTCSLTCSLTYSQAFDLKLARIKIQRNDLNGTFAITISSSCTGCGSCAKVCPSGCLSVVQITEGEG